MSDEAIYAAYAMDQAAEALCRPFADETRYAPEVVVRFWAGILHAEAGHLRQHWEEFDAARGAPRQQRPWTVELEED